MKIAFFMINCNRRDGSARAVNEVVERLATRHEIHLFARRAEDLDISRIAWHRVRGPSWPEVVDFSSYHVQVNRLMALQRRRTSDRRYEIAHSIGCNAMGANVITIQNVQPAKRSIMARLAGGECVSAPRRFTRWLYLRVTSAAEHRLYTHYPGRKPVLFLPVSRGVEAELRKHYDIGPSQVRIVPNAADIEKFKPLSDAQRFEWRSANGIEPDDIVALFAGGEWARKGLDFAIGAIASVRDRRVKLYVAGDDPDKARFERMAREAGCQGRIIFGGFRSDIAQAMGAADLFLFPSWYEAFSLATIEAAACGLPVVATRINGTEDFIRHGENGEFIEHDSAQICSVLDQLTAAPERLKEMGRRARKLVEEQYTWDRVSAMTEKYYLEHLSSRYEHR